MNGARDSGRRGQLATGELGGGTEKTLLPVALLRKKKDVDIK